MPFDQRSVRVRTRQLDFLPNGWRHRSYVRRVPEPMQVPVEQDGQSCPSILTPDKIVRPTKFANSFRHST
jgi:hypothetical protein